MTDERSLRDALRAEADGEPMAADAWARVAAAVEADDRRRRRWRIGAGAGVAALAAAAAVSVGLAVVDDGDDGEVVSVTPPTTADPTTTPAAATTITTPATTTTPAPTTTPSTSAAATTALSIPPTATVSTETTGTEAPPTSAADDTVPPMTTVPTSPDDPVLAITADGRVVTLSAADGSELLQLGAVSVSNGAQYIGVSQANGVAYYSGPFEETGRIWQVPVAGGAPVMVAFGAYPAISPDGATLAFVRPNAGGFGNEIVLFDVDTNQEISATTWDPADEDFFHLGGSITRLEWSPDGAALVFQTNYEGSESLVFRPSIHATLTDAEPVGVFEVLSPTWAGTDRIESVSECCYPEYTEPREVRMYELGVEDPVAVEQRPMFAVDRRPAGDRSAEIDASDTDTPYLDGGTLVLRAADGAVVWETTARYLAVSV